MKRNLFLLIGFIGLIGLLSGCEKDETKVVMLDSPIPPSIVSMPNLTLQRANANQTIIFTGTPVDPGFTASALYTLEAAPAGTNFANPMVLYSGPVADTIRFRVSDLNTTMLRRFPADQVSSIDFRLRAQLVVDAGTGALGTSTRPLQYFSAVRTVNVTLYGLPRLDLINSGITQKIESPAGDGIYTGFVKLNPANAFTLRNPDTNVSYGSNAPGVLVVNGAGIVPPAPARAGWHFMRANTTNLTFSIEEYMIGLIGSATPNGWNAPDQKMEYNPATGTWSITITLVDGEIKFRKNDGWAWNLGGTPGNLVQGGPNIPVTAGNYTITLTIINDQTGTFTIVRN